MDANDWAFLRQFAIAIRDKALSPDDPRYVPLYDHAEVSGDDPVQLLTRGVEWSPGGSVQLFSGFRGTGKSTELRRLAKTLHERGFLVALVNLEDYVNLSTPVEVSDFLLALMGALGEKLADPELLGEDPSHRGYWERFQEFVTRTNVDLNEIGFGVGEGVSADVKLSLKEDPSFRQKLQKRMAGHLGALVRDVREYVQECVRRLHEQHGAEVELVVLVDSAEKIRGTYTNAKQVQASVEDLFAGHPDKLQLRGIHVVYAVPPYLNIRYPGVGGLYGAGSLKSLPAVRVRNHEDGAVFQPGLDILEQVVAKRGDWQRLLGSRDALDEVLLASGGHLRDLLRLLIEILGRANSLPVSEETRRKAIDKIRNDYLPISDADAKWLDRVARTHRASFENVAQLPHLARFLDTLQVLVYHNNHVWYDVHPLIRDQVRLQAEELIEQEPRADDEDGRDGPAEGA